MKKQKNNSTPERHIWVAAFQDGKTEYVQLRTESVDPQFESIPFLGTEQPIGYAIATFLDVDLEALKEQAASLDENTDRDSMEEIATNWMRESTLLAPLTAKAMSGRASELEQMIEEYADLQPKLKQVAVECFDTTQTEGMAVRYLELRQERKEIYPKLQYGPVTLQYASVHDHEDALSEDVASAAKVNGEQFFSVVSEVLSTESVEDLVGFLLSTYLRKNVRFRKCKYCGRYFPITGRSISEYCDRLIEGSTKTCKQMGYVRLYDKQAQDDPVIREYKRSYKAHNARVRRGQMSREEFNAWAEEARRQRELALELQLTLEEFKAWLDRDKQK